jgi:hypothetical protein
LRAIRFGFAGSADLAGLAGLVDDFVLSGTLPV